MYFAASIGTGCGKPRIKDILSYQELVENIVAAIPEEWLTDEPAFKSFEEHSQAYVDFLVTRIAHSEIFVNEAKHARESII